MKSIKTFFAAVCLSAVLFVVGCGIIGVATPHTQTQTIVKTDHTTALTPQQKEIVREGRIVEYLAANYGGNGGELTIEQANTFCSHLSAEFNIPFFYFTLGGSDPFNETIEA